MKTIAFITTICLMVLLLPVLAFGNPFLVCDPQSRVDGYGVILDSNPTELVAAEVLGLGVGRLCYDLEGIEPGAHTVEVWAYNIIRESAHVFFDFTWDPENPPLPEEPPEAPAGVRVIFQ